MDIQNNAQISEEEVYIHIAFELTSIKPLGHKYIYIQMYL